MILGKKGLMRAQFRTLIEDFIGRLIWHTLLEIYGLKVCGQFPGWRVPREQIPNWYFSDRHFPIWASPWPDTSSTETSPTEYFLTKTFSRPDIALTTCFSKAFFFKFVSNPFFVYLYKHLLTSDTMLWLSSAVTNTVEKDMD